jgi:hypothetical protein
MMTTMAAPIQSMAAPMLTTQTYAQPAVEYITSAPQVIEYAQPAPMVEYITSAPQVSAAPRDLLAMGNVVSERVISIEELASMDRYAALEAVEVQRPREIMVQQPQMVEYVQQAPMVEYVQAQPAVEYIQAPQAVEYIQPQITTMQPQIMSMAAPQMTTMAAPQMTYGNQLTTMAAPQMTYGAPVTSMGIQSVI